MYSMHQNEIFRLWRRYPYPTPDKRACRSSGRVCEVVITGLTRKLLGLVTKISPRSLEALHFFGILSAEISEVGRQFSIKIPNQNLIRRDIEVVITGLTRNFVVTLEPPTLNPLIYKGFARSEYNLIA